ncbi:hypothetical protein [Bacillus infantis]|jgi:hypothetical protein|uniref:hypothetical protein n=1 Tax=Bacillus infantis TaxID=324767 RepID=UPI002155483D|nr:hypothetical protein [Bacillus infantis]MCR6609146.1 hypothetical protein [Bacillus infantis]
MKARLILVEGLPGFGKSTTAQYTKEILEEEGKEVRLFLEGNLDHPADYDGVAYATEKEMEKLLKEAGGQAELIKPYTIEKEGYYLVQYEKMKRKYPGAFPDGLLDSIFRNDIYELPMKLHMELMEASWRSFADRAANEDAVYIFECCFIQNPLTIGMIKCNEPANEIMAYVKRLGETIKELDPLLIYLEQDDLESAFRKAVKERPIEWSEGFTEYYTGQGYGLSRGWKGLEGTLKVLEARKQVELDTMEQLDLKKAVVNNSWFDPDSHKELLRQELKEQGVI